jgi:5-methylcytosine-specific restriction endonuclease McrBC GTP-binding regulatory subunit McrB
MAAVATIVDTLLQFRNVVLEGVPGTGKTFAARGVAAAWKSATGRDLAGRAEGEYAIAMHPSTSYEDFVEGLRYAGGNISRRQRIDGTVAQERQNPSKRRPMLDKRARANVNP